MERIENGLTILNKNLKQVSNKLKVKREFNNNGVAIQITYRYGLFRRTVVGNVNKKSFTIVNPKLIGIREKDSDFISSCIHDFRNEYL